MADTVQTQQTVVPWDSQQSYLKDIFKQAQSQFKAKGPYPFPDQMTIGFTPQEQTAQRMTEQFALGGALDQTGQMQAAQKFLLQDVLNPASNQYLQQHVEGAIAPVREQLLEQILPQLNSSAVVAGAYGGDRQGIAQGLAVDKATENMLNTAAEIYSKNYQAGLDAASQALRQAPTTLQTSTIPAQILSAVGETERSLAQNLLNEDIYRWNFAQNLPAAKLAQYQGAVQGNYGGTATGTAPSSYNEPSSFEQGLSTLTTTLGAINTINDLTGNAISDFVSSWF